MGCVECGRVRMPVEDVVVVTCRDTWAATVVWQCPKCGVRRVRHAPPVSLVAELMCAGSRGLTWSLPQELADEDRHTAALPLGYQDLRRFGVQLDQFWTIDDWIKR